MPPGFTSEYTSKEQIASVPLLAKNKRPEGAVEKVDIKKLETLIVGLKAGIEINSHPLQKATRETLKKALAEAEEKLAKATEGRSTNHGLKPANEEAGPSAFFKGVKTAGKKTRRVKHRKRHTRRA